MGNKVKSASDDWLESASDWCVTLEVLFAILVVTGVLAEFEIALKHPTYDSWLEFWGSIICNGVVGFGVAMETVFLGIGHFIQGELSARSTAKLAAAHKLAWVANGNAAGALAELGRVTDELREAVERATGLEKDAATLRLQLERLKMPRLLADEKISALAKALYPHALALRGKVNFVAADDIDSMRYATDFMTAFSGLGIISSGNPIFPGPPAPMKFAHFIDGDIALESSDFAGHNLAVEISKALGSIGLDVKLVAGTAPPPNGHVTVIVPPKRPWRS